MHELNRRGGARAGKGDAPRRGLWCAHVRAEPARHAQDGAAQVKRALAGATVVAAAGGASAMDLDLFLASDPWRLSPLDRARRAGWHVCPAASVEKAAKQAVGVGAAGTARKVGCRVQTSLNFSAG